MISDDTKRVLEHLAQEWFSAADSESDPEEKKAFRVPSLMIEGILQREDVTHEDLRYVLPVCCPYPNWAYSCLLDLANAERDGRKVKCLEKDSMFRWEIEELLLTHEDGEIGLIYFIRCGENDGEEGGWIKIGWSTDVKKRLATLQTAHHERLIVLTTFKGTRADERELHAEFLMYKERGEWFEPGSELLEYIDEVRDRNCR